MDTKKPIDIFIVEDNDVFTMALEADIKTAFKHLPIKIHCFETGEACMEKFKQIKPLVVILDYHLNSKYPDAADGIKILDRIKKENSETNVIMLTGDDSLDIALRSFRHGVSDYIVKTETQFRKINHALLSIFKMTEAKLEAKRYKTLFIASSIGMALLFGGVTAIQLFAPSLLK